MKVFLLILIVGLTSAEYKIKNFNDLMLYHDECGTENNTPADALAKYKKQKYEANDASYCHIYCLSKKIGVFDDESGILVNNWVQQVVEANHKTVDEIKPIIEKCATDIAQFKENKCLWAFKGFMCTRQAGYEVIERKVKGKKY
uniref:CSON015017 protein n=1 Tax=Culicoides sonorensis TaxID=179676 RepID=A0A336MF15_CULSO